VAITSGVIMFGTSQKDKAALEVEIAQLKQQIKELKEQRAQDLRILRQQLASMAVGISPRPESILNGLPYSEIPKEEVLEFIGSVPNLLLLDVRSDTGWNNGYIPNAKHVPAPEVFARLGELADKTRPILTFCANGNTALGVCQLLAREGYQNVFNALGGMAGYSGELIRPEIQATDITQVKGTDRKLITKVLAIIDRDVRPGLKRDGGDLQVVEVEDGTVKLKLVGACVGCGSQKRTVQDGIKNHLRDKIPEIEDVIDLSMGIPN
jgi:Fe-S cluster biogenesis protein NfuA/rhodanese-related sulfurtransferase